MRKPGQPSNALELTAGRRIVLNSLMAGTAGREAQSMAANWLRDLYDHYGLPREYLERDTLYRKLMSGTATATAHQQNTMLWIQRLLDAEFSEMENAVMEHKAANPSANDRQPGGDHYRKKAVQHWDFVDSHGYDYLSGQITKYISRWRDKGGELDLEKADHFLEKAIEVHDSNTNPIPLVEFLATIEGETERLVVSLVHAYVDTQDPQYLRAARAALRAR